MAKPELHEKTEVKVEESNSLRGTFTSVMFLGGFLVITWIGVFILFLSRF
ncbi:cytochrome c oxidase subunit 2A [Rossellomorea sp. AcN35-11]|nr:cytochrome c oxidase subunit 2A [Rossellomorea aquimaris]NMH70458.1 cytochrome c oxidase subunit 2A [Bacillus sp. RO3]WJV28262.1 cytochrome c oxidase subunit 2A [Rossellomorea sp. AcN35-11]